MIRNIVFDMGNVLIDYTPNLFVRHFAPNEADARLLEREIFYSDTWIALDAGQISIPDALRAIQARLPATLSQTAQSILENWYTLIRSDSRTTELVKRLKHLGYRVYLLSNANVQFDLYKQSLPVFPLLDGYIVSAFERVAKPHAAIYQLLTSRYGLLAEETLFVDDVPVNVEGAIACGWHGYCFEDRQIGALMDAMRGLGMDV